MERLSSFVLAHRRWIFAFWVVMFVAGIAAAGKVPDRLSYDFSLPGQQGYETEQKIIASYQGANAQAAYVPVVTVPAGPDRPGLGRGRPAVYDALRTIPTLRVVDYSQTQDTGFITGDGRTTFGIVYEPQPQGFVDPNQKRIEDTFNAQLKEHGFTGGLTGYEQLSSGGGSSGGPSVLEETLLGALGALAVLAFVFASLLALVPLLIAAVSILTTFLIVLLLTTFTDVSFVVQFLIALVGLGVAIDYSLLVVSRWREEIAHGHDNHGGRPHLDADGRSRGVRVRRHGRHQPDRAGRHPGAAAAQHGLRRHADPAVQRRRRADPAAGHAGRRRAARRHPAHPQGGRRLARAGPPGPA